MNLSNKTYIPLKPGTSSDLVTETTSCLIQLMDILDGLNLTPDSVIKQTIFLRAEDNDDFNHRHHLVSSKLMEFYDTLLPPTSIVGQPPEDPHQCVMELILMNRHSTELPLIRKSIEDITYTVVQYPDTKEVYAGGLTSACDVNNTLACSRKSFDLMEKVLTTENLTYGDVVRQWNYIEGIVDRQSVGNDVLQNYQIFNDVRSEYYSKARFDKGYPAATGIGMNAGGIILEFIAVEPKANVHIIPIHNPKQIDAHRYSDEVLVGKSVDGLSNKTSPKFERAKYLAIGSMDQIFLSGTAAIRGQESSTTQDVRGQTVITIENMQALISDLNLSNHGIQSQKVTLNVSYLRAYAKVEKDIDAVRDVCESFFPGVPALYLIADICRDDLLVELEGIAEWR